MLHRFLPAAASWLLLYSSGLRAQELFFDSNGVKLHYTISGKGEPVLLIHGFSVTYPIQWVYPGISSALAKHYQVIGLDCRGHGQSGKPRDPKMYGAEMVEDVVRLLDHLKIKKAHLVGYSMGGFIVLKMVATHPDRILTATTAAAGFEKAVDSKFLEELAQSLDRGKGIGPLLVRLTPAGYPKPTEGQLLIGRFLLNAINDQKALAAVVRGFKDLAICEQSLKYAKVPLLALVGELDPLKPGVDSLKELRPDVEVEVIKRADHMNAFYQPEFINALNDFLARHGQNPKPGSKDKKKHEEREKKSPGFCR
jgi:pimeloyl-ACP methyl ester carboxylesterase